jgi:hypothetical protein
MITTEPDGRARGGLRLLDKVVLWSCWRRRAMSTTVTVPAPGREVQEMAGMTPLAPFGGALPLRHSAQLH